MDNTVQYFIKFNGVDILAKDLTDANRLLDILKVKLKTSNGAPAIVGEIEAAKQVIGQMQKATDLQVANRQAAAKANQIAAQSEVAAIAKAAKDTERIALGTKPLLTLKINGADTALFTMREVEQAVTDLKNQLKDADAGSAAFKQIQSETLQATSKLKDMQIAVRGLTPEKSIRAFTHLGGAIAGALSLGTLAASQFSDTLGLSEEATKKLDKSVQVLSQAQHGVQTILLATNGQNLIAIRQNATLIAGNIRNAASNATVAGSYILARIQATLFGTAARTALAATGIGLFIVALTLVVQYWDYVKQGAEKMGSGVKEVFGGLVDFLRNYYSVVTFGLVDSAKQHAINAAKEEAQEKGKIRAKELEDQKDHYGRQVGLLEVSEAEKKRLLAVRSKEILDVYSQYYNNKVADLKKHYDLTNAVDVARYNKEIAEDRKHYEELQLNFQEANKTFDDARKKGNQDAVDMEYAHQKKMVELSTLSESVKAKQLLVLQQRYAADTNKQLDEKNDDEYKKIQKNNEDVASAKKVAADAANKAVQEQIDFEFGQKKKAVERSTATEAEKASRLLALQQQYTKDYNKTLNSGNDAEQRTRLKNLEEVVAAEVVAHKKRVEAEIKRVKATNDLTKARLYAEGNLHDGLTAIDLETANYQQDIRLRRLNGEKISADETLKVELETSNKRIAVIEKFNELVTQKEREHQVALRTLDAESIDLHIASLKSQLNTDDKLDKLKFAKRLALVVSNSNIERQIATEEAKKATIAVDSKYDAAVQSLRKRYDEEIKLAGDNAEKLVQIDQKYAEESQQIEQNSADAKLNIAADLAKKQEDIQKKQRDTTKKAADDQKAFLLEKVQQVAGLAIGILDVMAQAVINSLNRAVKVLDTQAAIVQQKVDYLKDAVSLSDSTIKDLEEKLSKTKGSERDRLIAKLELERKKRKQLTDDQLNQGKKLQDFDKQKAELERVAAEKKRKYSIAQSLINTAQGITLAFATNPFPLSLITAAVVAATGAVQLAAINQQQFANGGIVDGASHAQGGVQMFHKNGAHLGEMEGGEFVTRKAVTSRNFEALDMINRLGDTTTFTVVPKKFALGGVVGYYHAIESNLKNTQPDSTAIALNYLMQQSAQNQQELINLHNKPVYVDVREIKSVGTQVEAIQNKALKS